MFNRFLYIVIILLFSYSTCIYSEDTISEECPENITGRSNFKSQDFVYGVFFSQVYSGIAGEPEANPENIDKKLITLLNMANKSIYAALYDLDSHIVANAMVKAKKRGIDIALVTDTKSRKTADSLDNASIKLLKNANIPIVADARSAFMHNKFIVVDNEWVWTGSTNTTDNGFYKNNNNAILIRSTKLAENFKDEFDEMFKERSFGIRSDKSIKYPIVELHAGRIKERKIKISTLFAPENSVDRKIIKELRDAKKSIYFYAFSFTHDIISQTMISKHKSGVKVSGVFDNRQISKYSEFKPMKNAGIDVRKDNNAYIMHHKVIIIDGITTILGSFNFSSNASKSNDENVLIVKDSCIANNYLAEFRRLRK